MTRSMTLALVLSTLGCQSTPPAPNAAEHAVSTSSPPTKARAPERLSEILPLLEKVVATYSELLGPEQPVTLNCTLELARAMQLNGRLDEARALAQHAATGLERVLGPAHAESKRARLFVEALPVSKQN